MGVEPEWSCSTWCRNEIVGRRQLVELAGQGGPLGGIDGVDQHVLLAADHEVGVIARAVGQRDERVEQAPVPVDVTDEVDVLADRSCLHGNTPPLGDAVPGSSAADYNRGAGCGRRRAGTRAAKSGRDVGGPTTTGRDRANPISSLARSWGGDMSDLIWRTDSAYDFPLLVKNMLAAPLVDDPEQEIVYRGELRFTYRQFRERVGRLAAALRYLGIGPGDTVAVMDWDSHRYLECFYAVPMIGAVLHTVNVRLSPGAARLHHRPRRRRHPADQRRVPAPARAHQGPHRHRQAVRPDRRRRLPGDLARRSPANTRSCWPPASL